MHIMHHVCGVLQCRCVPYDASHGCPAEVVLTQVPAAVPTALHPWPSYPPQESARQKVVTCKEQMLVIVGLHDEHLVMLY